MGASALRKYLKEGHVLLINLNIKLNVFIFYPILLNDLI